MAQLFGVCLLPATGEFAYDPLPAQGAKWSGGSLGGFSAINCFYAPGGAKTDYAYALDQLQAAHPECQTVALVCAWFGNSSDASKCQIYPSTNFIGGAFETFADGSWAASNWQVSGLTQDSPGLIPISSEGGAAVYGGTPSDQSIVRCLRDLKARGFRVVFYPFILMDAPGKPWRGRISLADDLTVETTSAVNAFLGEAMPPQFSRDAANLTVSYAGPATDYSYRRFILHYANLCVLAGGVDLFLLGSELRGLEVLRGPNWTPAGATDVNGCAIWDYPFVAGLTRLAGDVRATFDGAGLAKNQTNYKNLVAYSADWSSWNGWGSPGANGQWPHLDSLFASAVIDVVALDNYLPLSDWTLGGGGLDCQNWSTPAPPSWPASEADMNGLGLAGQPSLYSAAYLQANIEGGEGYNWYYVMATMAASAWIRLGRTSVALCRRATALSRRASRSVRISSCWPGRLCAGGGTISIGRSMTLATDKVGRRMARRRNGRRRPSRSSSRNMALQRSTAARTSQTCFSMRARPRAARRTGACGRGLMTALGGQGAPICSPIWRCRRFTITGVRRRITRRHRPERR